MREILFRRDLEVSGLGNDQNGFNVYLLSESLEER